MIIGFPKRTLLALPRAFKRAGGVEPLANARVERARPERTSPLGAFNNMMERQAELILRQLGE